MKDYKRILEDNKDNAELLQDLVREVNSYDGSLEGYEAYDFDDDFFDTYFPNKPMDAVQRWHFGGEHNWNDEYIRFDGYGNLETLDEYQYAEELKEAADEIITEALRLLEDDNIEIDWILERLEINTDYEEEQ